LEQICSKTKSMDARAAQAQPLAGAAPAAEEVLTAEGSASEPTSVGSQPVVAGGGAGRREGAASLLIALKVAHKSWRQVFAKLAEHVPVSEQTLRRKNDNGQLVDYLIDHVDALKTAFGQDTGLLPARVAELEARLAEAEASAAAERAARQKAENAARRLQRHADVLQLEVDEFKDEMARHGALERGKGVQAERRRQSNERAELATQLADNRRVIDLLTVRLRHASTKHERRLRVAVEQHEAHVAELKTYIERCEKRIMEERGHHGAELASARAADKAAARGRSRLARVQLQVQRLRAELETLRAGFDDTDGSSGSASDDDAESSDEQRLAESNSAIVSLLNRLMHELPRNSQLRPSLLACITHYNSELDKPLMNWELARELLLSMRVVKLFKE
jgi:hypothetical protein